MSDTPKILKVNQQAGLDAVSAIEHLSDQELSELVLQALIKEECPVSELKDLSLLGMDTSFLRTIRFHCWECRNCTRYPSG